MEPLRLAQGQRVSRSAYRRRNIAMVAAGIALLVTTGVGAVVLKTLPGEPQGGGGAASADGVDVVGAAPVGSAVATPSASATAVPSATSGPATAARPARTFPTTAGEYARAALTAWLSRDSGRLGELGTPAALTTMGRAPTGLAGGWEVYPCWVEPFSPCLQLRNDTGDVFSVSVDSTKLGKPRAITRSYTSITRYETTVLEYLYRVIDGWYAKNDERVATLIDGQEAVWFFTTIQNQGDHTGYVDYVTFTSSRDPANRVCISARPPGGEAWLWAIDKRRLGKAHALVWAGAEQVC